MNAVCFIQRSDTIHDNNSKTSLGYILCDKAEVDSFMTMQYILFHYTLKGVARRLGASRSVKSNFAPLNSLSFTYENI